MRFSLPLVILALLSACGGGSDGTTSPPVDNTPAAIAISPSTPATIVSGASSTLTVGVTNRAGGAVSNASVVWTSTDPSVASVSAGVVTGVKVGSATITATLGTLTASVGVTVTAGAPAALALRTQPVGSASATPLATQPVVEVRDAAGNLVTSASVAVTAAIASGGGTLGGTTTVTSVNGVATFTDLVISGVAGPRILSFTAPLLSSATSAPVVVAAQIAPLIVLDVATINLTAPAGTNAPTRTVTITNGGSTPFSGVTIDPVAYDAGQPTGWLAATLNGATVPLSLLLVPSTASLPAGSYHAVVRVNAPGATNTPATISVNLTVEQTYAVTYGANTEKVRVLDIGGAYTPVTVSLTGGLPQPISTVTFRSRATSVATVDAAGKITAAGPGQTWVVAALQQGAADSVFVTVAKSLTAPLLRTDLTTYVAHAGDTIVVNFILEPRGSNIAAATVVAGYETENSIFTILRAFIPTQTPMPIAAGTSPGVIKSTVASATPLTAPVTMVQLTIITRTAGLSGFLTFTVLDAAAADGSDLSVQTTSTRYPIIVR